MEPKRLYRSRTQRVFAGVCGGLGEYFDVDPILFRILFVVVLFIGGGGLLVYIILWIALPEKKLDFGIFNQTFMDTDPSPQQNFESAEDPNKNWNFDQQHQKSNKTKGSLIGGMILIGIGSLFMIQRYLPQINFRTFWPLILVVIGVFLILNAFTKKNK